MNNFYLKLMSGETYVLGDEQVRFLLNSSSGQKLIAIPGTKIIINTSSIQSIVPEEELDQSLLKEAYLKDGSRVIKKFGSWYLADEPDIRVDEKYHPELQENSKTKQLRSGGMKPLSISDKDIKRLTN